MYGITIGISLKEGPRGGGGGVCIRFYEENKVHLRFTKIIDSHLRFTKIIRKYIGISCFSLRKHVIFIYGSCVTRAAGVLLQHFTEGWGGGGGHDTIKKAMPNS